MPRPRRSVNRNGTLIICRGFGLWGEHGILALLMLRVHFMGYPSYFRRQKTVEWLLEHRPMWEDIEDPFNDSRTYLLIEAMYDAGLYSRGTHIEDVIFSIPKYFRLARRHADGENHRWRF